MEKIEKLLSLDMGISFDTPKKLNRSDKSVPAEVVEQIENGEFTSEAITQLKGYPVFKYRSCITIHGLWPTVERTRIGGYKNIHQNANGSLEVYYSAIDRNKVERVRAYLAGTSEFRYNENSQGRVFQLAKVVTKETLADVRAELEPIAERVAKSNIYGYVNVYVGRDFFRNFLVVDVVPLAIPENEVERFTLALSGLDKDEHGAKNKAFIAAKQAEEKERADQWAQTKLEITEKKKAIELKYQTEFKPLISHLTECNDITAGILVKVVNDRDVLKFMYCRTTGKGSFGRVQWQKAWSETYTECITLLDWKDQKQQSLKEFKLQGYRMFKAGKLQTV